MPPPTLKTPWFTFNEQPEFPGVQGEHLNDNNPYARSVADSMFNSGVICSGMLCRKGYESDHHTPDFHDIRIMLQGTLTLIREDGTHELTPGAISYTLPKTPRKFFSNPNEVTWWLYVRIEDLPDWEGLKRDGSYIESYESTTIMYLLLRRILDAFKFRNLKSMSVARGDSHVFLRFLRLLTTRKKGENRRLQALREIVSEISRNPGLDWNQEDLADRVHVSSRTMLRLFKDEYGCSPMEMVFQQRINLAMTLLNNTDDVIEEVARHCGYENVSSFIRVFRKQVGTTPGQFRKSVAEESRVRGDL